MTSGGLYVHIPFCESKCYYCSFFSKIASEDTKEKFVDELCSEIKRTGKKHPDYEVKTIYFGGGTPSILSEKQLEKILSSIHDSFLLDSPEITLEINPTSSDHFRFYKQVGVNRISVGVQSTSDEILQKLGRKHTANEAIRTLENARNYFQNVSADLIIGVSEFQDPISDFDRIKDYIEHLSAYILTVEEKTALFYQIQNNSVAIATEEECVRQYENLVSHCAQNGFLQYETSNFSREGYRSRHNSSYWNLTPYLGFGPGAHSYYNGVRYYNASDIGAYLSGKHAGNGLAIIEREKNIQEDKNEYVMLALRTTDGIDLSFYKETFKSDFYKDFGEKIKTAERFLHISDQYISILPRFFLVQNSIIEPIIFA